MDRGVFISYRRSDRKWAQRLAECLSRRGVSVWYDGAISPGQDWRDEIIENIELARIILVLFSSDVNASAELKKELSVAGQKDKLIIVVRIENAVPQAGYAYELSNRNWYDAFDDPEKQLDEVAAYIAKALASPTDLEKSFKISADELKRRRRLRLLGSQGLLRNNTFLVFTAAILSIIQFFAYNSATHALEALAAGGVHPLRALVDVALVTSAGSPVLLLAAVQQPLAGMNWLIVPCSLLISGCMLLMLRNFFDWLKYSVLTAKS